MLHTNWGRNNYNALQTEFTMRPTQGTSFQATWAWDKIMDFPAPYFNPTWFIDPKHPDNDYVENWATTSHVRVGSLQSYSRRSILRMVCSLSMIVGRTMFLSHERLFTSLKSAER